MRWRDEPQANCCRSPAAGRTRTAGWPGQFIGRVPQAQDGAPCAFDTWACHETNQIHLFRILEEPADPVAIDTQGACILSLRDLAKSGRATLPSQDYRVDTMIADEAMPVGFEMGGDPDELQITYRSRGTGCMIAFLVVGVSSVTAGVSFFALQDWRQFQGFIFAEWWTPLAFAAGLSAAVNFTFVILWLSFGITEFIVSRENLIVRKKLLGFRRERQIPSELIKYFEQVKDGGGGEDTFPSWGLRVRARRLIPLLARQPIEKSDWLGRILSHFYHVEFRPCERRT